MTPVWLRALGVLRRSRGSRQVLTLVTGAAAAQAVLLLARPVLTRLYPAEAFGLLSVFVAPAYLLATVGTLRYEDAVAVPARDRDGAGLAVLAAAGGLAVALGLALTAPARAQVAAALGAPELAPLLPLVPVVVGTLAAANAAQAWLARVGAYRVLSLAAVVQSALVVGVQLAWPERDASGLVLGTALGAAAFAGVLAVAAVRTGVARDLRWPELGALARRWRRFPQLGLPASALVQLAARLPPLVLVASFGPTVVGHFAIAVASVSVPVGLVADAAGQVFAVRGAEAQRAGRLGPLVERVHGRLVAAVAFPVLAVALLGPDLFAFVFGEPWRPSGLYARVLSPWLLLGAVGAPLTRAFDVTERQRDELLSGAATAGLIGTALTIGAGLATPAAALAVLAGGGVLARVVQIGWVFRLSGARLRRGALDLSTTVASAALGLVPSALGLAYGGLAGGIAGALAGGIGYGATVLRRLPEPPPRPRL